MIPIPSAHFIGRECLLSTIESALVSEEPNDLDPQRIFVLTGMIGSGKTEVALKFLEDNYSNFDGVFWIDASSKISAEHDFSEMAKICGFRRGNIEHTFNDLATTESSWLLILDGCDDANLDYRHFIPPDRKGSTLITTRNSTLANYGKSALVENLDCPSACELLLRATEIPENDWQHLMPFAQQIVKTLSRHTLTILHAGALIKSGLCPLQEFPRMFDQNSADILQRYPTDIQSAGRRSKHQAVWETLEVSVEALESSEDIGDILAQRLLRILAFMNSEGVVEDIFVLAWRTQQEISQSSINTDIGSLSPWHVQQAEQSGLLHSWPNGAFRTARLKLLQLGLITRDNSPTFSTSIHPVIASWVRGRLDPSQQGTAWATTSAILSLSTGQATEWKDFSCMLQPHLEACFKLWSTVNAQIPLSSEIRKTLFAFCWQLLVVRSQLSVSVARLLYSQCDQDIRNSDTRAIQRLLAQCLSDTGEAEEAVELLSQLVDWESGRPQDPHLLALQHDLGEAYWDNQDFNRATTLLEFVVNTKRTIFAPDDPELLASEQKLASAHLSLSAYEQARPLLEHVLEARKRTLTPEHPHLLESQHEMATLFNGTNNYDQGIALLEEVMEKESSLRQDHPDRITTQHELASAYLNTGEHEEAIHILEDIVTTQQVSGLKPEHPHLLASQHALGCAYKCAGWYEKAVEILGKVTEMESRVYGSRHENTKLSLKALTSARQAERKEQRRIKLTKKTERRKVKKGKIAKRKEQRKIERRKAAESRKQKD